MPRRTTPPPSPITDPDFALLEILTDPSFPKEWALFDGRWDSLGAWVEDAGDHPQAPAALDRMLANGLSPLVRLKSDSTTLLHLAVSMDRLDLVGRLVERMRQDGTLTTGIDHRLSSGRTALWMACNGGENLAMVNLLLNAGADPHVQHEGRGLIWEVCNWSANPGRLDILKRLMETRASAWIDQVVLDAFGQGTALHKAIVHDNADAVRLLLKAGADPSQEYKGQTAEALLAERGEHNPAMAKLLVEWRVDQERQVLRETLDGTLNALSTGIPSRSPRRL